MTSLGGVVFTLSAGVILYTYAGYPLLLAAWASWKGRRKSDRDSTTIEAPLPALSIIVPAYNEEQVIEKKIRNTCELDYPRLLLEIVVVSDGSSDATESLSRGAAGDRVRLVFLASRQGKTACLNTVLPGLTGDIVVFTDANAFFQPDALKNLARRFEDPEVGCVMGELEYVKEAGSLNASIGEGLYWRYENFIKERESRLGSTIVGNGAIYAMRKSLCRPLPLAVEADVANPLLALKAGRRVVFERKARCWERAAGTVREEFSRKSRIITNQITSYLYGGRDLRPLPATALFQILSHKVLRWIVPVFLAGLLLSGLAPGASPFLGWMLNLQVLFYVMAVAGWTLEMQGWSVPRPFFLPYYFCAVNAASVKGIADFLRGRRWVVWEKVESTR